MNLAAALAPRPAFRPRARLDVAPRASPSSAAPSTEPTFAQDVLLGLALGQKAVPSRWLHDARGKQLRGEIALLESHYPARNEALVLGRCAAQIAELAGRDARLIELGSSAGPEAASLDGGSTGRRRVLYIPGATLGGFATEEAVGLLTRIGRQAGRDALLVVGTDTTHDPAVLIAAYDDFQGVAAAFNKNLLARINRELDGDFRLAAFRHEARYNAPRQRVEMHLVSRRAQRASVLGREVHFAMGESILTECAYKHGLVGFRTLAARAGWLPRQLWMDGQARVAVHVLERAL